MSEYISPHKKLLYHLDTINEISKGNHPPPVNVEIDLSNRCSLGCEWCHFKHTHTKGPLAIPGRESLGGDLMDLDLATSIIYQLHAAGAQSITWTGGGEPTLHPSFDDIVDCTYCETSLKQGLYTHGGHVDETRAKRLKRKLEWIYISLDEYTEQKYYKSKRVNRFQHAIEGIKRMVEAEGSATVGVGFLLHAENYLDVDAMVELALDELKADYVQFRPTILFDESNPSVPDDSRQWIDAMIYLLHSKHRLNSQVIYDVSRFEDYRDWKGHPYKKCYWSKLQTVITPNGKVWVCCNKREYPGGELGDLSKETFEEIWSRHSVPDVDSSCRVMCRGHSPNIFLNEVLEKFPKHGEFI